MLGQIKAAVQSGGEWRRLPGKQGERIIVEMKMQKIELAGTLIDALEHQHVQRVGIADRTIEPQCTRPYGFEPRRGDGIPAGEERYFVAECDQFLREPRHDALGSPIKLGRDRLRQGCDLGNMH